MKSILPLGLALFATISSAPGQEPQADESQMPRIPPTEPENALETFEVKPGFELKLVAREPAVVDPIAMAFDADGGLYVIEMRGYSERRDDALGRVRYLLDQDGDGIFEESTIFKDGLKWPTGIVCYKGGVFVGATPDLYYFKDTDGDGVSDMERLVFTGFGDARPELNMQALFNSFRWGPDNRIWGATASSGGTVVQPDRLDIPPVSLRSADFSFDPELLDLRPENGTRQFGMDFDSLGRRFVCSNSRHVVWMAYERSQVRPNPVYDLPNPMVDIPVDGAAAPVYRISQDEPWRIVRTRWRVAGVVRGMVEGGGRVSGYFTSASGIHLYWGNAYGESYFDNVFVGDVGSNLVHRKILRNPDGRTQPLAMRPGTESETEFIRSRDNWFRPVSFATGPDGCLYICDMYRETIEHPWSLPPGIKKHLDLNSGNDRGRIYRVEPIGFERPAIPRLSEASDIELANIVSDSNGEWEATTARRLLFERGIPVSPKPATDPYPAALMSEDSLVDRFPEWRGDRWLEAAVLNSLSDASSIRSAWRQPSLNESTEFEGELARMSGRTGDQPLIEYVAGRIAGEPQSSRTLLLLGAFKEGVTLSGLEWQDVERLSPMDTVFRTARSTLADQNADLQARMTALRHLALQSGGGNENLFREILANRESPDIIANEAAKGIKEASYLIDYFGRLDMDTQRLAIQRMSRTARAARSLLDAVASEKIPMDSMPAEVADRLRSHANGEIAEYAKEILGTIASRAEVVARYEDALAREGDTRSGETVFKSACVQCHQSHDGAGVVFGPPTATFKTAGKASILSNLLDPNREVAPQYQAFEFNMTDGESYVGMIAAEDGRTVTLRLPGGIDKTFLRTQVRSTRGLGRSLMPEGLEQTLGIQEVADLLAYLAEGSN